MNIFKQINSNERKAWNKHQYKNNFKFNKYKCKNNIQLDTSGFLYEVEPIKKVTK